MVVTITHNGYVKRVPIKSYERQKRGGKGKVAVTTHDDDFIERFFFNSWQKKNMDWVSKF